ncbi:GspH/FimT family pseudopilin [bacterium]|nr:GspH/FimT family pseudopilin [bacterium]
MKRAGFTMLEIMAVIVISGILAAIAVPRFTEFISKSRLSAQARNLSGFLRMARSNAIAHKSNYGVYIDTTNNTYGVFFDKNENCIFDSTSEELIKGPQSLRPEIYWVKVNVENHTVIFNYYGTSNGGYVVLGREKADSLAENGAILVRIFPLSGRITVDWTSKSAAKELP